MSSIHIIPFDDFRSICIGEIEKNNKSHGRRGNANGHFEISWHTCAVATPKLGYSLQ